MNILEAYILQKKRLTIVISCLDISFLREVGQNIANDMFAKVIDLSDDMKVRYVKELNIDAINKRDTNDTIKIILCPLFPDNLFNFRINYHINISLNKSLLDEKKIDHNLIELNSEISKSIRVNKFLNYHKFKNNKDIEDEIFNLIMTFIEKKLDDGKYVERVKTSNKSKKEDNKNDKVGEKLKEMEDNPKNNRIDNDIMEDIEVSSDDPLSDSQISQISVEDVNMDDDLIPTKDFSNESAFYETHNLQHGGISKIIDDLTDTVSDYLSKKIANKNEIFGSRAIKYRYIKK